jgi:pimeloyl-ACP methyl ester carboxylesterase
MKIVTSKDGTHIAYDVYGVGRPVIMVGGTMNSRVFGPAPAAELLGKDFAVYDYDRRGRGDSGDNQPYAPHKEIEDLAALIEATGGQAALCGFSAGGALAIEAAIALGPERITKLAMYEGPFTSDPVVLSEWQAYSTALHKAATSGDVSGMVMAFVGLVHANDQAEALRNDKATWQKLSSLAPTLMYDYQIIGPEKHIPEERLAKIEIPTLVICGGDSGSKMIADTEQIARLIPQGSSHVLPGQSHSVDPTVIAPVLQKFFA